MKVLNTAILLLITINTFAVNRSSIFYYKDKNDNVQGLVKEIINEINTELNGKYVLDYELNTSNSNDETEKYIYSKSILSIPYITVKLIDKKINAITGVLKTDNNLTNYLNANNYTNLIFYDTIEEIEKSINNGVITSIILPIQYLDTSKHKNYKILPEIFLNTYVKLDKNNSDSKYILKKIRNNDYLACFTKASQQYLDYENKKIDQVNGTQIYIYVQHALSIKTLTYLKNIFKNFSLLTGYKTTFIFDNEYLEILKKEAPIFYILPSDKTKKNMIKSSSLYAEKLITLRNINVTGDLNEDELSKTYSYGYLDFLINDEFKKQYNTSKNYNLIKYYDYSNFYRDISNYKLDYFIETYSNYIEGNIRSFDSTLVPINFAHHDLNYYLWVDESNKNVIETIDNIQSLFNHVHLQNYYNSDITSVKYRFTIFTTIFFILVIMIISIFLSNFIHKKRIERESINKKLQDVSLKYEKTINSVLETLNNDKSIINNTYISVIKFMKEFLRLVTPEKSKSLLNDIEKFIGFINLGYIVDSTNIPSAYDFFYYEFNDENEKHILNCMQYLSGINLNKSVYNIINFHHENWDGSGKIFHLKHFEIPIEAQLIRLTSYFIYLIWVEKKPINEVFTIIISKKGTMFKPNIIDLFETRKNRIILLNKQFENIWKEKLK